MSLSFTHAILEWARSKPADKAYDYLSNDNCIIAQFLKETGRAAKPSVDGHGWCDGDGPEHPYDWRVDQAANTGWADTQTFGAFAARLEKAMVR